MPKPVNSSQIEDVLSSIRRLVSDQPAAPAADAAAADQQHTPPPPAPDQGRADPAAQDTAEGASTAPPRFARSTRQPLVIDKLVLTPELRVNDPEDPWRPVPPRPERPLDLGQVEIDADAEFEPDAGDTDWPDPASSELAEAVAALRQARKSPEDGENDDLKDSDAPWETSPGARLFSRRALPEEEVAKARPAETAPQAAQAETAPQAAQAETAPQAAQADAMPEAAPETALDEVEDLGEASGLFTFPDTETDLIDEEVLRDMVAELVRQELQGVLGQRITRSLRKMVRHEIRLALAERDTRPRVE